MNFEALNMITFGSLMGAGLNSVPAPGNGEDDMKVVEGALRGVDPRVLKALRNAIVLGYCTGAVKASQGHFTPSAEQTAGLLGAIMEGIDMAPRCGVHPGSREMTDVELAKTLALRFHNGQSYGEQPYSAHLEAVVRVVGETSDDERLLIVAWLHDTVEDTELSLGTIHNLFGKDVGNAVDALTHRSDVSREDYIRVVRANPLARAVKLADAYCNMSESIKRRDMKRVAKYSGYINALSQE